MTTNASLTARFMGSTWGPPEADRTQVGPMWATWTLLPGLPFKYMDQSEQSGAVAWNEMFKQKITPWACTVHKWLWEQAPITAVWMTKFMWKVISQLMFVWVSRTCIMHFDHNEKPIFTVMFHMCYGLSVLLWVPEYLPYVRLRAILLWNTWLWVKYECRKWCNRELWVRVLSMSTPIWLPWSTGLF